MPNLDQTTCLSTHGLSDTEAGYSSWAVMEWECAVKSPEQGAKTSLHLACSGEVEGLSGRYFANEKEKTAAPHARDAETAARLWTISEELADLAYP